MKKELQEVLDSVQDGHYGTMTHNLLGLIILELRRIADKPKKTKRKVTKSIWSDD